MVIARSTFKPMLTAVGIVVVAATSVVGVANAASPGTGTNTTNSNTTNTNTGRQGQSARTVSATTTLPTVLWAVVNSDGTLARQKHAVAAKHLGLGTYEVVFTRKILNCSYQATIGLSGTSGALNNGQVTVVGRAGNATAVFIRTADGTGATSDLGFHLTVNC
jgi:hypothetical protein